MNKSIENIFNRQIEREAYSSLLYLSMASWAETMGYGGIAEWLYVQADEEKMHMIKIIRYVNERGGHAILPAVEKPPVEFGDPHSMFKKVLEHEQLISGSINEIVAMTVKENDYTTNNWIQWFVSEQIEEEANVRDILDKLKLVGEHNMYIFDRDILSMRAPASGTNGDTALN